MAIKLTRRVVEKRTVEIGSDQHAGDILEDWRAVSAAAFQRKYDCRTLPEAEVVYYAALKFRLATLRPTLNAHAVADLGVDLDTPAAPLEPTWTSQDGRTQRIRDMATAHLVNVLERYLFNGAEAGIFTAISAELDRRVNE